MDRLEVKTDGSGFAFPGDVDSSDLACIQRCSHFGFLERMAVRLEPPASRRDALCGTQTTLAGVRFG